jgi:hypothetical protein
MQANVMIVPCIHVPPNQLGARGKVASCSAIKRL